MEMVTDLRSSFEDGSSMTMLGTEMVKLARSRLFEKADHDVSDVNVV